MPYCLSHNAALEVTDTPEHLSLHLPYVIGYSVDSSHQDIGKSAGIFIVLSNIWMLLNIGRALNSGWPLQIQGDATFKVCAEAVGVLGIGVNSLGACNHWLALAHSGRPRISLNVQTNMDLYLQRFSHADDSV